MMIDTLMLKGVADEDVAAMHEVVSNAFCHLLRSRQLDPLTALSLAAMAVGSIYKEVAEAHTGPDGCGCGWQPFAIADIAGLQTMLASAAGVGPGNGLFAMPAAGHA